MRSRSTWILSALAALALLALAWLAVSLGRGAPVEAPLSVRGAAADSMEDHALRSVEPEPLRAGGEDEDGAADSERVEPPPTGATLTGRVTSLDGEMDLASVRVALWAERTAPNCAQFAVAGPRSVVMRLVRAASDGTFAIEDLDPGTRYHLRAGGGGRASLWLPEPVAPGGAPVTLELARVKALRVELVGTDGKPPRTPPEMMEDAFSLGGSEVYRAGASLEPWEQELTGLPGVGCSPEVSPHGGLVVLSGPPERLSIGPIHCSAYMPGYAAENAEHFAELVVDRIPLQKLVLRPNAPGWGSVEFEFVGLSHAVRTRIAPEEPLGALIVELEGVGSYVVKLHGPPELKRLDGLPVGGARWFFDSYDGYCQRPTDGVPAPFEIGGELTRITVDLSNTGGVLVELDPASRAEAMNLHHVSIAKGEQSPLQLPAQQLPRHFLLVDSGVWQQTAVGFLDAESQVLTLRKLEDGPAVRIVPGEIATLRVITRGRSPDPVGR